MSSLQITSSRSKNNRRHPDAGAAMPKGRDGASFSQFNSKTFHVNFKNFKKKVTDFNRLKAERLKKKIVENERMCKDHIRSPLSSKEGEKQSRNLRDTCEALKSKISEEENCFSTAKITIQVLEKRASIDAKLKAKCNELKKSYEIHNRKLEKMKDYYKRYQEMREEFEKLKREETDFKKQFVMAVWKRYDPIYGLEHNGSKSIFNSVWA